MNEIISRCTASSRLGRAMPADAPLATRHEPEMGAFVEAGKLVRRSDADGDVPMLGVDTDIVGVAVDFSRFRADSATPSVVRTRMSWIDNGAT